MKKMIFTRILAIALVAMSIMAVDIPAMAGVSTVNSNNPKYKSYNISSSPSYDITAYGTPGDRLTVCLDLNDLEHPISNGNANWKVSKSITLTISSDGSAQTTISPGSSFKYVSGRSDKARLRFKVPTNYSNKGDITVYYPD